MVLTKKDLDDAVDTLTERIIGIMDEKLTGVAARITSLEDSINVNKLEIESQMNEISDLKLANAELNSRLEDLTHRLENHVPDQFSTTNINKKVIEIEERLEERTNRQLRQTLVFRGIHEQGDETWDDTKNIVANVISKNIGVSVRTAENMLNRVHRGRHSNKQQYQNKPRPVYAALYRWEDCEEIVEEFRDLNIKKKSSIQANNNKTSQSSYEKERTQRGRDNN